LTLKKGASVSYSVVGDNGVKAVNSSVADSTKKQIVSMNSAQASSLTYAFTAPANGSYTFNFGSPSLANGQGYILVAFEDPKGHEVTSAAMADFGDVVSFIYNEATSGDDALTVETNRFTLFSGPFQKTQTMTYTTTGMTGGVYAFFAAAEDDRQTLKFSIANDKGEVLAQDDETQPFASCLISQDTPKATVKFVNGSSKPRLGFVARFKAK